MTTGKPLRRYMARVEFLACKDAIDSMLAQGFNKKLIHERMIAVGRCSMSYITFCEFIRDAGKKHPPRSRRRAVIRFRRPPVRNGYRASSALTVNPFLIPGTLTPRP